MIMTDFSVSELKSCVLACFFRLLASEIKRAVSTCFTSIQIFALLPISYISIQACYRRLKECLIAASDQVRTERVDSLILFSVQYLTVFIEYIYSYFIDSSSELFNFIKIIYIGNPPTTDLKDYLINFL